MVSNPVALEYHITKISPLQDSIMLCSLSPVVIATAVWVSEWRNSIVMIPCNNEGVVAAINSGCSRVQGILHLLRCLFLSEHTMGIHIKAVHIQGGDVSRNSRVLPDCS